MEALGIGHLGLNCSRQRRIARVEQACGKRDIRVGIRHSVERLGYAGGKIPRRVLILTQRDGHEARCGQVNALVGKPGLNSGSPLDLAQESRVRQLAHLLGRHAARHNEPLSLLVAHKETRVELSHEAHKRATCGNIERTGPGAVKERAALVEPCELNKRSNAGNVGVRHVGKKLRAAHRPTNALVKEESCSNDSSRAMRESLAERRLVGHRKRDDSAVLQRMRGVLAHGHHNAARNALAQASRNRRQDVLVAKVTHAKVPQHAHHTARCRGTGH